MEMEREREGNVMVKNKRTGKEGSERKKRRGKKEKPI